MGEQCKHAGIGTRFAFTDALISSGAALSALSLVEPAQAWLEDPAGADLALTHQAFHGSPLPNRFLQGTASPRSPLPGSRNEVKLHSSQSCFLSKDRDMPVL